MILKNQTLISVFKFIKSTIKFFNKHFYILPIVSLLSKIRKNTFFKTLSWIIKIIILASIIFGVGLVLYFTDFMTPTNEAYDLYYQLFKPYIELIKEFYNNLINFDSITEDSFLKDSTNKIKNQVKEGMKESMKEVLDDVINQINEEDALAKAHLIKQITLISSSLFLFYFIFILPGASISPEDLVQYNWLNQSLIELKINIINLINKPTDPGAPGAPYNPSDLGITPSQISPSNSIISDNMATVTPNSPIISNNTPFKCDTGIQTNLDGITIGKMVETVNMLDEILPDDANNDIKDGVNKLINNITD